jgi:hypothetical protein
MGFTLWIPEELPLISMCATAGRLIACQLVTGLAGSTMRTRWNATVVTVICLFLVMGMLCNMLQAPDPTSAGWKYSLTVPQSKVPAALSHSPSLTQEGCDAPNDISEFNGNASVSFDPYSGLEMITSPNGSIPASNIVSQYAKAINVTVTPLKSANFEEVLLTVWGVGWNNESLNSTSPSSPSVWALLINATTGVATGELNDFKYFPPGATVYFNVTIVLAGGPAVYSPCPADSNIPFWGKNTFPSWGYLVGGGWPSANFTDDIKLTADPDVYNGTNPVDYQSVTMNMSSIAGNPIGLARVYYNVTFVNVTTGNKTSLPGNGLFYANQMLPLNSTNASTSLGPFAVYPWNETIVTFFFRAWELWSNSYVNLINSQFYTYDVAAQGPPNVPTIHSYYVIPPSIELGSWTNFTVNASGGIGSLSYTYTGLPNGCNSQNVSELACHPSAVGTFTVTVNVTDQAHQYVTASLGLNVVVLKQVNYSVTFNETGLPAGTAWYLNITGQPAVASVTTSASIALPNGTYSCSIATADKLYAPFLAVSNVTVSGGALFRSITFSMLTYAVKFTEVGLPNGTEWYLNVTGQPSVATLTAIADIALPNGTYSCAIATVDKEYATSLASSTFTVSGYQLNRSITFSLLAYTVMFNETGLPPGANWSVTMDGVHHSSTTDSIAFTEPNGTYSFTIQNTTRNTASPSSGMVIVSGANAVVHISFNRSFRGEAILLIIVVSVIAVIAVVAIILLLRRRKEKPMDVRRKDAPIDESQIYASANKPADTTPSPPTSPPKA